MPGLSWTSLRIMFILNPQFLYGRLVMKKFLLLFSLFSLFLLSACQPYYIRNEQVNGLQVGGDPSLVKSALAKDPDKVFETKVDDNAYTVQVYQMLTGQEQQMTMSCTQYGCFPVFYTVPVTEPYTVILKNSEIVFWGFIEELNKHDDTALNEIGGFTVNQMAAGK